MVVTAAAFLTGAFTTALTAGADVVTVVEGATGAAVVVVASGMATEETAGTVAMVVEAELDCLLVNAPAIGPEMTMRPTRAAAVIDDARRTRLDANIVSPKVSSEGQILAASMVQHSLLVVKRSLAQKDEHTEC